MGIMEMAGHSLYPVFHLLHELTLTSARENGPRSFLHLYTRLSQG